jgi:hypothetical protein
VFARTPSGRLDTDREGVFSFVVLGEGEDPLCISPCFKIPGIWTCC